MYSAATEPFAPGRFSTMIGTPRPFCTSSMRMRVVTSVPLPAVNGTMTRTVLPGAG